MHNTWEYRESGMRLKLEIWQEEFDIQFHKRGKCGRAMTSSGLKEYELKFGLSGIFIAKFIGNG
jgi:hypothetical protein